MRVAEAHFPLDYHAVVRELAGLAQQIGLPGRALFAQPRLERTARARGRPNPADQAFEQYVVDVDVA